MPEHYTDTAIGIVWAVGAILWQGRDWRRYGR